MPALQQNSIRKNAEPPINTKRKKKRRKILFIKQGPVKNCGGGQLDKHRSPLYQLVDLMNRYLSELRKIKKIRPICRKMYPFFQKTGGLVKENVIFSPFAMQVFLGVCFISSRFAVLYINLPYFSICEKIDVQNTGGIYYERCKV